jgi:DNA replication protein DnaC
MKWEYGGKGLLFWGPTGRCKTRVLWLLIQKLAVHLGPDSIHVFTGTDFGNKLARHYKEEDAEEWLEQVKGCKLVIFDDLGKLKLTDRAEAELFDVINHRTSWHLPIIATTELDEAGMADRMSYHRGPALIRRLREFCEVISF